MHIHNYGEERTYRMAVGVIVCDCNTRGCGVLCDFLQREGSDDSYVSVGAQELAVRLLCLSLDLNFPKREEHLGSDCSH